MTGFFLLPGLWTSIAAPPLQGLLGSQLFLKQAKNNNNNKKSLSSDKLLFREQKALKGPKAARIRHLFWQGSGLQNFGKMIAEEKPEK